MQDPNEEFRRLLDQSGWTQARAADELSVDVGTVNRYVKGGVKPSRTVLKLMAALRGVPVPGLNDSQIPQGVSHRQLDLSEQRLLDLVRRIPPKRRTRAVEGIIAAVSAFEVNSGSGPDLTPEILGAALSSMDADMAELRKSESRVKSAK